MVSTAGKAVEAIAPAKPPRAPERRQQPPEADFGGGLVGGLMSRAVGGLLRGALGMIEGQLAAAQEQAEGVQSRAAAVIEGSARLRERLGGPVRVLEPMAQSSMTSIINGRSTRTITLLLPVVGADGRAAQAQVDYAEGAGADGLQVVVQLPSGETLDLSGGGGGGGPGGGGGTIDVEWRTVDSK